MAGQANLEGRVAIVSGSSSGIGAAIARELAERGAHVVINYPWPSLKEEAEKVVSTLPVRGIAVEADMGTVEGPAKLAEEASKAFTGRINIVVNNAGIAVNLPLEEQTVEHWDALVNVNGRGTFLLTKESLKYLATDGSSRIINICSLSSRAPPPFQTIYAGTKGMVDSFTKTWAKELPPKYKCTVNSVSPGPTDTDGFATRGDEMAKVLEPVIAATPCEKRLGRPEEVAYAVAALCEDKARWMSGNHIMVCGGLAIV